MNDDSDNESALAQIDEQADGQEELPLPDAGEASQGARTRYVSKTEITIGPFPPPEMLRGYHEIAPELRIVDRIVSMAERTAAHHQQMELAQLANETRQLDLSEQQIKQNAETHQHQRLELGLRKRGQVFAATIVTFSIAGAVVLALRDKTEVAMALIGAVFGATAIIGAIAGWKRPDKD